MLEEELCSEADVKIEQIGLMPILLQVLTRIGLIALIDKHYPSHGNWQGASKGLVTAVWICYILCKCDHRVSYVEDWVKSRELSLNGYLSEWGYSINSSDFTDDRLGILLENFSDESKWEKLEGAVNKQILRVYDLQGKVVQLDATVGQSFKSVIKEGLFQYGHSKHFRSDLPQFKTMLATLSGIDMPLGSITVSGNRSDDELYIPMIKVAKASFGVNGLLYAGDTKLSSLDNRTYIVKQKDYYLCPLSRVQLPDSQLGKEYVEPILSGEVEVQTIKRKGQVIAVGYEVSEQRTHDGQTWEERRLVVRSQNYTKVQQKSLDSRLRKAMEELLDLNNRKQGKKVFKRSKDLKHACQEIVVRQDVVGLLDIDCRIQYEKKKIRAYKDRPQRIERKMIYSVVVKKEDKAIEAKKQLVGWRVYVTNQPKGDLSLSKALNLYREEYRIERRIRNLKEEVTALLPLFLKKDNRIEALINLLILVLKITAVMEYDIAKALKVANKELGGLYPGNPSITTTKPTIRKIIEAFADFSVAHIKRKGSGGYYVLIPQLSSLQQDIIELLGFSTQIFYKLKTPMAIFNTS